MERDTAQRDESYRLRRVGIRRDTVLIPRPLLLRAAELIEREAKSLYESHTVNGDWGFSVLEHADYDEMMAIANELRRAAG